MLMVAPSGKVKLDILFDTPEFFSTAVIVKGNVAPDDDVEKAVSNGVDMFRICRRGFALPTNLRIRGKVIKKCMINAIITVPI